MKVVRRGFLAGLRLFGCLLVLALLLNPVRYCLAQERMLSVGTHPVGTMFNVIGSAVAKVVSEKTAYKATVKAMAGPAAWFPYMARGEVDFGVLNEWDAEMGYRGEYEYKDLSKGEGFNVRLVALSVPNRISIVTAKATGITTLAQLKGKRLACKYPTPSLHLQALALLANAGLTLDDVRVVPVTSVADGIKAVMEGRVDAAGTGTIGMPILEELNTKKGAVLLPVDPSPEAVERTRKYFPGYPAFVKAGPTGVETDRYLWGYDVYVICRADLPDKAVYDVVKALYQNVQMLQSFHKALSEWSEKGFVSNRFTVPFHPGAISFYKQVGLWTPQMENLNSKLLERR